MAPGAIVLPDNRVIYEISEEEAKQLDSITLVSGAGSWEPNRPMHYICIMQALTVLTGAPADPVEEDSGEEISYYPVCVSESITGFMIQWNDDIEEEAERNKLKELVADGTLMNTRPVMRRERKVNQYKTVIEDYPVYTPEYTEAENARRIILSDDIRYAASFEEKMAAVRQAADLFKVRVTDTTGGCANTNNDTSSSKEGK